ncbi:hypothetical protein MML48_3g00006703 [Holotrichia oblita]|uniref:Uncharacterized protein n=1 Tax=Holotrichia oblita TaxID=644536 RepID=A0ACB9TC56_HOLOL|nr:hypothetical protein MML48_3g00006703 [Holotrichia oblita]
MEVSFLEELKKTWLTSLLGFVFLCAGSLLLTWNEGRAVHHAHSLDEAFNNVIALNPFEPVRPELEGRLVHISGNLIVDEPLTEPEYGVSVQSVKLKRRVQMYQWVEERTRRDYGDMVSSDTAETDYFYVTEWRDKLVDSRHFYIRHRHQNPTEIPLKTYVYVSPIVKVGQLTLGTDIKNKFNDYIEVTGDQRPDRRDIKLHLGIYYHCDDVWNPQVGDIRVQFYYAGVNGEPVTVVGMQKNGILVPYKTTRNHEIALLRDGILTVTQIFDVEHSDARWETWKLRGAGVFVLYISAVCLKGLIRILLLKFPTFNQFAQQEISSSSNLAISLSVSLLVISVTWVFYRPMIAIGLVLASLSPIIYCSMAFFNTGQNQNDVQHRR